MKSSIAIILSLVFCAQALANDVIIKSGENVQQKIDASASGDTIICPDAMNLTGINGKGDRTYKFANVTGGSGSTPALKFSGQSNFTITGSTFDNANLVLEKCSKAKVNGNTFKNLRGRSGNGAHVIFTNQLTDGDISGNRFENQMGAGVDTCIFNYDPRRSKFNDNHFFTVHEGIHTFWFGFDANNPWDCETNQNECVGIERHFIETQGAANKYRCKRNHVSKRIRNGINLSIATGGLFGSGGYQNTADIEVDENVLDNSGFSIPDYSQCMAVELMGRSKCRNNIIVNGGQGIAYTYNPDGTEISGNKFKGMSAHQIVTDVPHDKAGSITGSNDLSYTGAVPTYAQLIGAPPTTNPVPPPPPPPPTLPSPTLTVYRTMVKVVALPGAIIQKRAGIGGFWPVTLNAQGFDTNFDFDPNADEVASHWKFYYRQVVNGVPSAESVAQVGFGIDPSPGQPPPPPPSAPRETVAPASPYPIHYPINPDGSLGTPSTRPAQ